MIASLEDEDMAQLELEQQLGQVECVGRHSVWRLSIGACSWCKAAI